MMDSNNNGTSGKKQFFFLSFREILDINTSVGFVSRQKVEERRALEATKTSTTTRTTSAEEPQHHLPNKKSTNDIKWLQLFCSHQWESDAHPDPQKNQLQCLQKFIRVILELYEGCLASDAGENVDELHNQLGQPTLTNPNFTAQHTATIPMPEPSSSSSLERHGWIQAAFLMGFVISKFPESINNNNNSNSNKTTKAQQRRQDFLDHCFVWYDYACLYQKPRNAKQEADFRWSLQNLPTLIKDSATIALYTDPQHFYSRGWCAFEISESIRACSVLPLILRMDLFGILMENDWLKYENLQFDKVHFKEHVMKNAYSKYVVGGLQQAIREWNESITSPSVRQVSALKAIFSSLKPALMWFTDNQVMAMDVPPVSQLCNTVSARINAFCTQTCQEKRKQIIDLEIVVKQAMTEVGLSCTNGSDVCFLAFTILQQASANGYGPPPRVFSTCLDRYMAQQSLEMFSIAMEVEPACAADQLYSFRRADGSFEATGHNLYRTEIWSRPA